MDDLNTICVIDDDPSIRSSTEGLLRSYGYLVRTYVSADEFLDAGGFKGCDCIVSDVQMPGKSGFDLLAELSRLKAPVPVVLITAYFDKATAAKAKAAGAACILPKPFQANDLIGCIENAVRA